MEKLNSNDFRDNLAEKAKKIRSVDKESAQGFLEKQSETPEYIEARRQKIEQHKARSVEDAKKIEEIRKSLGASENTEEKTEKIRELDIEINGLLDEISSKLPNQMVELVNSESYKKLLDLHEKRIAEEKVLFETYERYTKGHDEHHRGVSTEHLGVYASTYIEDMKACGLNDKDAIKRFEDFKEKYIKPEQQAEEVFNNEYNAKINKDRWDFEKTLTTKSGELFGKDRDAERDFQKKYFDIYQENYNKAKNNSIPDKQLHINTRGTIYSS